MYKCVVNIYQHIGELRSPIIIVHNYHCNIYDVLNKEMMCYLGEHSIFFRKVSSKSDIVTFFKNKLRKNILPSTGCICLNFNQNTVLFWSKAKFPCLNWKFKCIVSLLFQMYNKKKLKIFQKKNKSVQFKENLTHK